MCWKVSCCSGFCGFSADANVGQNSAGIATASNVGAIASAGQAAIAMGGGNISTTASRSLQVGNAVEVNRVGASSIGADGYLTEYTKTVAVGDAELSIGEKLTCCTDEGCCTYSLDCCGADCGVSSVCCTEGVESAVTGCFSCLGDVFSNIGDLVSSGLGILTGILED